VAYAKPHLEYRKSAVGGASPVGLVVMLYDGALRFMERGKIAIAAHDLAAQNEALQKAQRIVLELMGALDMRKGGEIAQNLLGLYGFVLSELVAANTDDDATRVDNAVQTMTELRAGWAELESRTVASVEGAIKPGSLIHAA